MPGQRSEYRTQLSSAHDKTASIAYGVKAVGLLLAVGSGLIVCLFCYLAGLWHGGMLGSGKYLREVLSKRETLEECVMIRMVNKKTWNG